MIYELKAQKRQEFGKKLADSREDGLVPAVIYGPDIKENVYVFINKVELKKVYEEAGESSVINLSVEGEKSPRGVLIKDIEFEPVKGTFQHLDFYQFMEGHKLDVEAELKFVGEAPAVKTFGGILVKNFDAIKIRCLPQDIISEIAVDLSSLKNFGDRITIKDLNITQTVEIQDDINAVVVTVVHVQEEKEEAPTVEANEVAPGAEAAATETAGKEDTAKSEKAEPKKPETKK